MSLKKTVAVLIALALLLTVPVSCKKEDDGLLHTEDIKLNKDCTHSFTEVQKSEENCVVTTVLLCGVCAGVRFEYRAAEGHEVVFTPGKVATCSGNGQTHGIHCNTCNKTHSENKFIPLNVNAHLFTEVTEPATLCTGSKLYSSCLFCHKSELISSDDKLAPPESAGVPVLFFEGDLDASTKEKPVNMTVKYQSEGLNFSAYATMKVQGNTSAEYEKKNYNLKLYEDEAHTKKQKVDLGWGKEFKYCLKANYIDASHARNIVNARLFAEITANRKGHNPILDDLPNMGLIDGFPVALYLNGEFYGMYTLNIPKDKWLMGMKDDETVKQAILMADDWQPSVYFKEPIATDYSNGWELEHCTTQNSAWVRSSFNEFIKFVGENDGAALRAGLDEYIDVDSFIDTMLFYIVIGAYDNYVKNMLYVTYDGGDTWMCIPYDLDSTWGLYWDGSYYVEEDKGLLRKDGATVRTTSSSNILWTKLLTEYRSEIKARYDELRSGTLSNTHIMEEYDAFFASVPDILYKSEAARWPNVPQLKVDQRSQISTYMEKRLEKLDGFMKAY